jgi:phosphoribosylamine--glycine ligase
MMSGARFGQAGARVVLEECLSGPEVSFFVLTDGLAAMTLGTAQDHKARTMATAQYRRMGASHRPAGRRTPQAASSPRSWSQSFAACARWPSVSRVPLG